MARLTPSQQNSEHSENGAGGAAPPAPFSFAGDGAKATLLVEPPWPALRLFAWQENQGSISNNPLVGCGAAYGVLRPDRRSPYDSDQYTTAAGTWASACWHCR